MGRRVALYPLMTQGNPLYTALKFLSNYGLDYLNSERVMRRVKSLCSGSEHEKNRQGEEVSCNRYCTLESRPAAVLSSFSFAITLLFIVFKGNRRESGSEEGILLQPANAICQGVLLPPLAPHHTRRDTLRPTLGARRSLLWRDSLSL